MTKSGMVTRGEECVYRGQPPPHPGGAGPGPQFLGPLLTSTRFDPEQPNFVC